MKKEKPQGPASLTCTVFWHFGLRTVKMHSTFSPGDPFDFHYSRPSPSKWLSDPTSHGPRNFFPFSSVLNCVSNALVGITHSPSWTRDRWCFGYTAGGTASGKLFYSSAFHIPPILVFPTSHTPSSRGLIAAFKHVEDSCNKGERTLFFISVRNSRRITGLTRSRGDLARILW